MEVLSTTTSRPRFIPTKPVVMSSAATTAATSTMTRSLNSHNHHHHQQQVTSNYEQSSSPSVADTTIRDKTRLLQLAEKVHTRKSGSPNYTKSFRSTITSAVTKGGGGNYKNGTLATSTTTPTVRRTNSTMFSSSMSTPASAPPASRPKLENYKNPKLYASFSSKSCSKLTKALIKSDPAKTNIEHLVNYKSGSNGSSPKGNNEIQQNITNSNSNGVTNGKTRLENGEYNRQHYHQAHNGNGHGGNGGGGGGGGGLSSFITPLKALHASFHERSSKLGQTRSKLFSHHHHNKDISSSNAKLLFGTTENLHSTSCSSGSSSEDILAPEIIAPSKRNHYNKSSSRQDQKQLHQQRRAAAATTTTTFGANNNKNVTPAAALTSTAAIREQILLNGNGNSGSPDDDDATAAVTIPPDFLDGFRNENSCSSNYNGTTNGGHASYHHHQHREINGSDTTRVAHEQEIANTNSTNSFITPDILGGCLDVPKGTSNKPMLRSTSRVGAARENGICENNQHHLSDELRQTNEKNYNIAGHLIRGTPTSTQNMHSSTPPPMAQLQKHLGNNDNKDILQKRKNIVVRMSFHNDNDDETNYNDLYHICQNGEGNNENGVASGAGGGGADGPGDIWPISPITVSTVTPKTKPIVPIRTSSRIGHIGASSSLLSSSQLIKAEMTNNCSNSTKEPCNSNEMIVDANSNGKSVDTSQQNDRSSTITNNGDSRRNKFEAGGGGGISHQQRLHNIRSPSSLSSASNSASSLFMSSQDGQKHLKQHQQPSHHESSREQQLVAHSSQQPQDEAAEHLHNPRLNHYNKAIPQTPQSHSPEATGSSTWLQTKNSFAKGEADCQGVAENVINSNRASLYCNGIDFMKKMATSSSSDCGGGEEGNINNASSSSSTLTNLNGRERRRCNENINSTKDNAEYETDDAFKVEKMKLMSEENDVEEGRERSRRGMFMEAETSFSPHQKLSRNSDSCSGRLQTALLSDEYARYLGYGYDNDEIAEVQQKQTQAGRLHVLHLGNKNRSAIPPSPCREICENGNGSSNGGGVFGADEERNMTLLAITTSGQRDRKNGKMSVTSIMKGKRQEARPITHSVSFRGTIDSTDRDRENQRICLNGIAEHPNAGKCESVNNFDRKRSRSLPKSFMSVRNGLISALPSQWVRDGLSFERLNSSEKQCPAEEQTIPSIQEQEEYSSSREAIKMRWNKLGSSSSTSASFSDRRPKSFDYAQRKAWMKFYRDMEVSQASSGHNSPAPRLSRPISKGSITHLHLQEASSSDPIPSSSSGGTSEACRCDYETSEGAPMSTMMRSSTDVSETSPSLFKRFSKTFSLRFGSGSNVSKHPGDVHRKAKSKGAIGSSPDLFNRVDGDGSRDKVNGKMRKSNVKSVRGDKCQSGDSGIGMEEQQTEARQISNLRRIRSDYISSTSTIGASPAVSSYASRQHTNTSALAKLSLVEIPDHSWDEHNSSPNEGSGASDTASYEELVDAKLDRDDGFSSSDEGHHSEQVENPTYYHTLPHRKHNKRRLKETESVDNGAGEVHHEDNSIRGKVVREIIHTEQNYVKTLNDIVQGFLNPCRARNDLFSSRTVQNIFSNIEDILKLHVKFLEALKSKVDPNYASHSNVGGVFTSWADRFSLYSEYCCNNPISVATVRSLVQFPQYAEFFEACRRLQMMDKLPLHGFLLRPIQRICQYHLQLNELLKHTEESHTDHQSVVKALETMKSVATKINDTQRQFESLQEIIRFQNSIDGWEGPNLVDRNSVILRKGELVKVTHGRKQKEVYVAILNKDLIYCKKDFMKKSGYVFDGRIDLNLRMWINIDSNEEDEFFGMVHNSWRIYSPERRAWILFTAPSPTEKRKWINALEKTKESIVVDPKLREMAVVTTALADSEMMYGGGSQSHHSNTLPKSSKKSKGKHLSVTKVDSDAMLIEVGKLKRSTMYTTVNQPQREGGSSKFYV